MGLLIIQGAIQKTPFESIMILTKITVYPVKALTIGENERQNCRSRKYTVDFSRTSFYRVQWSMCLEGATPIIAKGKVTVAMISH